MTVRAVIFDVGNVLYDWSPRYLYERLIADDRALDAFLRDVITHDWHFQHDAGRDFAETSAELIARFPEHADLIAAWGPRFNETIGGLLPGMEALVTALAVRGVPLYAITNFGAGFWAGFRPTAPIFDHFRDIVVSGEERLVKPDPAIYRLALDRFGLSGPDALFIDDRAENVAGARAAGMMGHHFSDAEWLRGELIALGLLD